MGRGRDVVAAAVAARRTDRLEDVALLVELQDVALAADREDGTLAVASNVALDAEQDAAQLEALLDAGHVQHVACSSSHCSLE